MRKSFLPGRQIEAQKYFKSVNILPLRIDVNVLNFLPIFYKPKNYSKFFVDTVFIFKQEYRIRKFRKIELQLAFFENEKKTLF